MPIYEFYCPDCHMVFEFFSKCVNTGKRPLCPRCRKRKLERQISRFAMKGGSGDKEGMGDFPVDENKMERAITALAGEAERIDETDPRQAAGLIRKFSGMTGIEYGKGMEEALGRMEAGEDPEKVESEMGDLMEAEEPFVLQGKKGKPNVRRKQRASVPRRDDTLYEL